MKFKKYLTEDESSDIEELNNAIQNDCKPYLKLIKGKDPLYRGMVLGDSHFMGKKRTRPNRQPLGSPQIEFDYINLWLPLNGHNSRNKNVVMCSSHKDNIETFGDPYMIFPMGNISYTWMDSKDFNYSDSKTGWDFKYIGNFLKRTDFEFKTFEDNVPIEEYDKTHRMKKPFHKYFHTNKGFDIAYKNSYEIWFKCKSYYYININTTNCVWDSKYGVLL